MRVHARVWFFSAALGFSGCGVNGSDEPPPKSGQTGSHAGNKSSNDLTNGGAFNRGGGGGQFDKGGALPSAGGGASGAGTAGVGGTGANAALAGASAASGSAGANAAPTADCPSLTRARLASGACVDRIQEFAVAKAPTSIVTGSDGQVWFDDDGSNRLVQLDSEGRVLKTIDCAAGSSPRALVGGRDDALVWYTDARAKTLTRQTRTARSTFQLGFTATAIALGEGDELWATEAGHAIYQVRPDVAITPYPDAPSNALVVASENDVWFPTGSVIARLIPAKGTQYFTTGESLADDMCMGPDGALWFSDGQRDQIGRMERNGAQHTFDLPLGSTPTRIIMGPDGALWFTETGADKIGRITVKGELTQYPIPTSGGLPYALTVGGDRNIWFTEKFSGKVGRLLTDPLN